MDRFAEVVGGGERLDDDQAGEATYYAAWQVEGSQQLDFAAKQMAEAEFLMELDHPNVVKVYSIEFSRLHNIFFFVIRQVN